MLSEALVAPVDVIVSFVAMSGKLVWPIADTSSVGVLH